MTSGQHLALAQLQDVEASSDGTFEILSVEHPSEDQEYLRLLVSVSCAGYPLKEGGLPLRQRERFLLVVRPDFPFSYPWVYARHTRFAGSPHVQWGRYLCLYLAPDTEWDPSDGMYGLLSRLDDWLQLGAAGQLDPDGAPLHPPVAYQSTDHLVIPRVNTPELGDEPWYGLVEMAHPTPSRTDLGRFHALGQEIPDSPVGAALLLPRALTFFEFPKSVADLLLSLKDHDVNIRRALATMGMAALHCEEGPLLVVIGSPMRGVAGTEVRQQHLVCWRVEAKVARDLALSLGRYIEDAEDYRSIADEAEERFWDWAKTAEAKWCSVREARPEVTRRRDRGSRSTWFTDKSIAIWGCGALGGYFAEFVVRAGARRVVLHDKSVVMPGVLVRQPFFDDEIGLPKAEALASRLARSFPRDQIVEGRVVDVRALLDDVGAWAEGYDLIVDCTASRGVLKRLERAVSATGAAPTNLCSIVIGPDAAQGLAAMTPKGYPGGPADVLRATRLDLCENPEPALVKAFWPTTDDERVSFQPEPGCSDVTFLGSAADVAGLAADLSRLVVELLEGPTGTAGTGWIPDRRAEQSDRPVNRWTFQPGVAIPDPSGDYSVRFSDSAWSAMRRWIQESAARMGRSVETGGVLFGQRDDAARVIWIDEVTGPPLDSEASGSGFVCGVVGVDQGARDLEDSSEGATAFVGMWHTHPDMHPTPSDDDHRAIARLHAATDKTTHRTLLVILGGDVQVSPIARAYTYGRAQIEPGLGDPRRLSVRRVYPIRWRVYRAMESGLAPIRAAASSLEWLSDSIRRWFHN